MEVCYQCHPTHDTRKKQETHERLPGTESQRCMCLSPSIREISRDSPTQSSRYCEYIENEESQSISYCDVQWFHKLDASTYTQSRFFLK